MACEPQISLDLEDWECTICCEVFTDPRVLPCGHLLCHICVLRWVNIHPDAKCPLCRHVIVEPAQLASRTIEDIVSDFPTDNALEVLCEAERLLARDHQCCICHDVLTTSLCLDCKDMFCQSCITDHRKQSATKEHIVEDLSSLSAETLAAKLSSPCSSHPDVIPEVFCPNHGATICFLCASTTHSNCQDIQDLTEKMAESRRTLDNLITRLTEGETKLDKGMEELDQHQKHTEKCLNVAVAQAEAMFDRLDLAVKENRRKMKELIEKARRKIRDAVNEGKSCFLRRKSKLTTHKQIVERAQRVNNRQAITSMSAKMEHHVDYLDFSVTLPDDDAVICDAQLFIDLDHVSRIEQQLAGVGEVKLEPACLAAYGKVPQESAIQQRVFCFHDNHGKGVILSNCNMTASKTEDRGNGIVMSSDPVQINTLYEVQIDQVDRTRRGNYNLCVGVVVENPEGLTLPFWSGLLAEAISVSKEAVKPANGDWDFENKIGYWLGTLETNSRAGFYLDSDRRLHVYVDGQHKGLTQRDIPDPCYAMFDVVDKTVQVTALPLTRLSR